MVSSAWTVLGRAALAGLLTVAACAAAAQSIFVCVDARGRRLTSDRPIPECLDRDQKELNPSGSLRRLVAPAQSEQERMAEEARRRAEAQARYQAQEDVRRDRLLLVRYPTPAVHDAERAAALSRTREVEEFARQRIVQLQQERRELDDASAVFRGDPAKMPAVLRQDLTDNGRAITAQQNVIAAQDEERRRISARFDTERVQLRLLWVSAGVAPPSQ